MSSAFALATLLTAEEYMNLSDDGVPTELIRGRRVEMNRPYTDHGYRMGEVYAILREYVRANNLGRVAVGDAGVITRRDPDTVRGPDIAYYGYQRVPPGPTPEGYWPVPDLTIEIRSQTDRWQEIYLKVGEYLDAGVLCALVIDPFARQVQVFTANQPVRIWNDDETLILSDGLPGFSIEISKLFEQ